MNSRLSRLAAAIDRLARQLDVDLVPEAVVHALEVASAASPDDPRTSLEHALVALGLATFRVQRGAREVIEDAARLAPLLAIDDDGGFVLVTGGRRARARVEQQDREPRWVDAPTLTALVGARDADEPVTWLSADARRSLRAPPSSAGAPAHDAHDPHGGHHVTPWARLRAALSMDRGDLVVVAIYAAVVSVLALAAPLAAQALVTAVSFGSLTQPVVVLSLLVVLALSAAGAVRAIQLVVVEGIQRRLFVRLVSDVAHRLPRVRGDARSSLDVGKEVNRFFDVVTIQKAAATLFLDGLTLALELVVALLLMALYHPYLLGFAIVVFVLLAVVVFGLGRGAIPTSIAESWAKHAIADWFEEVARHPLTFARGAAREAHTLRADALARRYLDARQEHFRVVLRQSMGLFGLQAVTAAALLGFGGALVLAGQLTLGQLVAAELVVAVVVAAFGKLGKQLEIFYDLIAAAEKVGHLVDLPTEPMTGEQITAEGPATLRVVDAGLTLHARPVLRGASLRLGAGDAVALIGGSGVGKSALVDAIQGLVELDGGAIEIDGVDVRSLSREALRVRVAVVREPEVFAGTVAENVRAGDATLTSAGLMAALRVVELDREILDLPGGLNTPLRHGGFPLSASQALRLTMARAIAARPGLLILDGALDAIEAGRRQRILERLFESKATLMVATHAEDIVNALPRGLALREGTITELAHVASPLPGGAR